MDIKVEPDKLKNDELEILSVVGELESYMNRLEDIIWSLSGEWQGETQIALSNRIIVIKAQYSKFVEFMKEYAVLLGDFSEEFRVCDHEIAQKIELT